MSYKDCCCLKYNTVFTNVAVAFLQGGSMASKNCAAEKNWCAKSGQNCLKIGSLPKVLLRLMHLLYTSYTPIKISTPKN